MFNIAISLILFLYKTNACDGISFVSQNRPTMNMTEKYNEPKTDKRFNIKHL